MKKLLVAAMALLLVGCGVNDGKETGSKDFEGKIQIYSRDASSGTREAFEKGNDFEGKLTKKAVTVDSNGDMATKVGTDKYGIGYVSLSTDFEANKVTPLAYDGVKPSQETVLDNTYKLQRPFEFVTRAKGDFGSDAKEQLVAALLDYMQNSTEGMLVVEKNGGIVDKSKGKPWAELKKNHPIVDQDNSAITIQTAGSTSVEKTLKGALEAFSPMAGNYKFAMNQSGSSDGYKRVLGAEKDGPNKADIGFASRAFEGEENTANAMMSGQYCIDAVVAIISNQNTAVTSLNAKQIKQIFTGEIKNWKDVK